jgi:hypothetical protein
MGGRVLLRVGLGQSIPLLGLNHAARPAYRQRRLNFETDS